MKSKRISILLVGIMLATLFAVAVSGSVSAQEPTEYIDITLQIGGKKGNSARMNVYENEVPIASVSVIRESGSPKGSSVTLEDILFDNSKTTTIEVFFTPYENPNGGKLKGKSKCWITIVKEDGSSITLTNTFNNKDPDTWTIVVNEYI